MTDWGMPRMDGLQLIEHIRGSERLRYTYLIMLTGRSEKIDLVAGMEAGADDFLSKPFDRNELRVRLSAGERIIRLERELASQNEVLQSANERMKHDLEAAAQIQHDLLPKELPDTLTAKFAWHFEPCDELGGDILNVLPLDEGCFAMYLLDVSGHGVPAALLSVTLSRVLTTQDPRSSLLIAQNEDGQTPTVRAPREVAERLNRQFPMETQHGYYFTMAYAVLDTQTGVLRYTLAGHPPPILVRRGTEPKEISGGGLAIGLLDTAEFEDYSIQLEPGDRLLFYSDGITESTNGQKEMLEAEGFIRLIEKSRAQPLDESVTKCVNDLKRWTDSVPFADDISLLVVEIPDPDSPVS